MQHKSLRSLFCHNMPAAVEKAENKHERVLPEFAFCGQIV